MDSGAPAKASDVFESVVLVNDFKADYLPYNQKLDLAPEQLKSLQYRQRVSLWVSIACLLPLLLAALAPGTFTYSLAIFGLIISAVAFSFYWMARRDFSGQQIAVVEGLISRDMHRGRGKVADFYYFYVIDGRRFRVLEDAYNVLTQDIPVRAYYAPASMILLNMELLDKVPEPTNTLGLGKLPYTDF